MLIIATHSIWEQPSLVPTPQPVLCSYPCYTNILYGTTVISTSRKKKGGGKKTKTHSASVFENLESFETEHYFFLALAIEPFLNSDLKMVKLHWGLKNLRATEKYPLKMCTFDIYSILLW